MFGKLFYLLNFRYWHLVIWYDLNIHKQLVSRSYVLGLIQIICTVFWQDSAWKAAFFLCPESISPTSVIFSLFCVLHPFSVMFAFLQYINVFKSALSKKTTLSEFYASSRYNLILFSFEGLWGTMSLITFCSSSILSSNYWNLISHLTSLRSGLIP